MKKTDVTFDAYLENNKHQVEADIENEIKLYLHINVKSGYLENAAVNMQGANFKINVGNTSSDVIERIDTENGIIYFNQLNKGKDIVLEIPVIFYHQESFEVANLEKENSIKLTGSYMTEDAETVEVEKEIKVKVYWTSEANVKIEQTLSKYSSISKQTTTNEGTENISQTLIQTTLKASLENNSLPVKETQIQVKVPELNGQKPTEVSVIATNLEATNGGDGTEFTSQNYTYDSETGILAIKVQNPENDGKVIWKKNAEDEYHINYVYDFAVASLEFEQEAEVTIQAYEDKTFSQSSVLTNNSSEQVGSVISNSIQFVNEILNKGYLYESNNYKTEYQVTLNEEIDYLEMLGEGLSISPSIDKFITKEGQEVDISSKTKILEMKIKKENFDQILGEEGSIQILQNGNVIATISKETALNESQEYVVELNKNSEEITFVTSKPIAKGKLQIEYSKQIDLLEGITEEQIANFASLKTAAKTEILKTEFTIPTKEIQTEISLQEPVTTIDANINKTNLSTITKNEDVQINIVLKNNGVQYDLYKNPVIQIELPSYMTSIEVKELKLLYEEEMALGEATIQNLENGNRLITIPITGEQTKYHTNDVTGGAAVVLNADITMDQLTPSKEDVVKISVTNEKAHSYENTELGEAYKELNVQYVAPTGMVTVNEITMNDQTAMSISGEKASMQVDAQSSSKTANVEMTIINNNELAAEQISILGRVPFAGNKDITTGEDLGSTFNANMTGQIVAKTGIEQENLKIYYSQNETATKDLTDANNGWQTEVSNFQDVKSYLVVIENYELAVGGTIELSYPIQIPENLKHSQETNATYAVYYTSKIEGETNVTPVEVANATSVEIVTPQGPDLEVTLTSNVAEGETVKEGQIVQYTVTVKNIGNVTANTVIAYGNVPEGATYVEKSENGFYQTDSSKGYVRQVYETLEPQESQSFTYAVKVKNLSATYQFEQDEDGNVIKEEYSISNYAEVTAQKLDTHINSNTLTLQVEKGNLTIELKSDTTENVKNGQEIVYTIKVSNPTDERKENVTVIADVPEGAKFLEGQFTEEDFKEDSYNTYVLESSDTQIKWNIPNLTSNDSEYITYTVVVEEGATQIKNSVAVTCDNITTTSNEITNTVRQLAMEAIQSCDIDTDYIMPNDIITYTITVKNTGNDILRNVVITDPLPEQLECVGVSYSISGKEIETDYSETIPTVSLEGIVTGGEVQVKIKAKAGNVENDTHISNVVKVTATDMEEIQTNAITHTIKAGASGDNNNPGGDNLEGTYNISGTIWLDNNQNAQKDEGEDRVKDIRTLLINKTNGNIIKETTTDATGKYEFTGLNNGEYIIIFMYDNEVYKITDYQKLGVETSKNSDATQMEITLDGESVIGAVTDTLMVKDANLYNIDLGLLQREKFDLKLEKQIASITVQNTQGTKEYTYEEGTTLAKVDISPKYIDGTNVVITYKIKITNEGDVAGYAKNIVDYLSSSDVKFSSELNTDWYQGNDGNIYTTSLANTIINPGETKEITLIVTKQMTEENTGLVNNTAEIYESYNDYAIADNDSTPGNKVQSEDDYGKANIYLSLNTGGAVTYTIITIVMISILGIGAYFLKKKVLKKI